MFWRSGDFWLQVCHITNASQMKTINLLRLIFFGLISIFLLWISFWTNTLNARYREEVSSLLSVVIHDQYNKTRSLNFFDFVPNPQYQSTVNDSTVHRFKESDTNEKQSFHRKLSQHTANDWEKEVLLLANKNRELGRKFIIISAANYGHRELAL